MFNILEEDKKIKKKRKRKRKRTGYKNRREREIHQFFKQEIKKNLRAKRLMWGLNFGKQS